MLERHRVHRDADGDLPAAVTAPLLAHPPSPAEPWPANFGSSEITDEEIDAASAACCRICLESESEPGDVLISPCMCKGTQQFVHRSCLDHWRSVKEGTAFSHCTTCKARFHLRVEFLEDDICRRMKFRMFVARDVIIIFLLIQAVRSPSPLITLYCSLLFMVISSLVIDRGQLAYIISLG
uniref:RING-CH-type domain-containing protein n=1 Tax=Zea mays TaxID=4577 RepID=A0A804NHY5_MAIZE